VTHAERVVGEPERAQTSLEYSPYSARPPSLLQSLTTSTHPQQSAVRYESIALYVNVTWSPAQFLTLNLTANHLPNRAPRTDEHVQEHEACRQPQPSLQQPRNFNEPATNGKNPVPVEAASTNQDQSVKNNSSSSPKNTQLSTKNQRTTTTQQQKSKPDPRRKKHTSSIHTKPINHEARHLPV
jgi:hypothetical protein